MVVTRRQSAGPLPAVASRTSSTSGSSRSKGKGVDKTSSLKEPDIGPTRILPNGTPSKTLTVGPEALEEVSLDDRKVLSTPPKPPAPKSPTSVLNSRNKSKKSIKAKKRHPNKGISIFDILSRLFLLWFTIYSLSVCPDDVQLRSPVCRALTEYRRLVLEPFVYPHIRAALDHPSIAPHIRRAQPYYNRAVQTTKPWVRRSKDEWRTKVVPRVQWLQLRARPYVRRMECQYDAILGPYVRQASDAIAEYRVKAEPYILSATLKTRRKWIRAKPYFRPVLRGASHVPDILVRLIGRPLGDARRQWVDPQVAKIWAAVVEKGQADTVNVKTMSTTATSGSNSASSTSFTPSTPNNESPTLISMSTHPPENISVSTSDAVSISSPLPGHEDEAATSVSSIVVDNASPTPSSISIASVSVSSIPESDIEGFPLVNPSISKPPDEAAVSVSSVIQESFFQSSESSITPSSASSHISSEPSPNDENPSLAEEEVEDLEKFLTEIGLNDDPGSDTPPQPPPVPQETEEDPEELLRLKAIETAEKRADIEGRHTQWESDLEKFGKAQRKVVRAKLNRLREAAVEEARAPGAVIRMHVDGLLQEAEKSLKSLKAYTRKLAAENKPESEKIKTWENVVNKVNEKFAERVEAAADGIREWWSAYVNKETEEVLAIGAEVTEIADRAQFDLAIDYSWLADVTYEDWQRYHRLVETSKKFTDLYIAMQNGTHKSAPANPLIDIMEALQEEVDDMVLGFEANLTRVKNVALDMFSGIETKPATTTPEAEAAAESDLEASILPIDPIRGEKRGGEIPPVILSRGAEDVEAAVSMAEEAKTKAAHEEL